VRTACPVRSMIGASRSEVLCDSLHQRNSSHKTRSVMGNRTNVYQTWSGRAAPREHQGLPHSPQDSSKRSAGLRAGKAWPASGERPAPHLWRGLVVPQDDAAWPRALPLGQLRVRAIGARLGSTLDHLHAQTHAPAPGPELSAQCHSWRSARRPGRGVEAASAFETRSFPRLGQQLGVSARARLSSPAACCFRSEGRARDPESGLAVCPATARGPPL